MELRLVDSAVAKVLREGRGAEGGGCPALPNNRAARIAVPVGCYDFAHLHHVGDGGVNVALRASSDRWEARIEMAETRTEVDALAAGKEPAVSVCSTVDEDEA